MPQENPYQDGPRAAAYAKLGIENTYYLAYRDLPELFGQYGMSGSALDYGCGTGRSTRFLRDHGFSAVGVDISAAMVVQAREHDKQGDYRMISPGDLRAFPDNTFDVVLSVMPFDSIATMQAKVDTLREIGRVLKPGGFKILVASSREVYLYEWVSFSTSEFPENRLARSGETVRVIVHELGDRRAVEDILWTEEAYKETFRQTPFRLLDTRHPTALPDNAYHCEWISETKHAPWVIFILQAVPV